MPHVSSTACRETYDWAFTRVVAAKTVSEKLKWQAEQLKAFMTFVRAT